MAYISKRQFVITFVPSIVILVVAAIASVLSEMSVSNLTKDVASLAELHPLSGALSTLGILLWCVTTSVCLFAAIQLRVSSNSNPSRFLLSSGLLSAYLMLDDAFLFHEDLALLWFGIGEEIVMLVLGVFVLIYLVCFARLIWGTRFGALFLAFVFLALSVVVDTILAPWLSEIGDWMYLLEDGAKWLGIAFWCSYFVKVAYGFVTEAQGTRPDVGNAAA